MENLESEIAGLYKGRYKGWMETFSGRRVNPLNIRKSDISIKDIAHALSLICRYGGHSKVFYSVAEHSIRVSYVIDPEYKLAALLHDSAEAYLGDIIRPLKHNFPEIIEAERRALHTIFLKYGIKIDTEGEEAIKRIDNILCATEARDLMSHVELWGGLPQPLSGKIKPYPDSEVAEVSFLYLFEVYGGREC